MDLGFEAAVFDMDGVITRTAGLHAAAWKQLFDDLLRRRTGEGGEYRPFDAQVEYRAYVDGKPRREGVRSFLRARHIELSDAEVEELAQRKNELFERKLREDGAQTFASSIALIQQLRDRGIKIGVVSSSRHGREILETAGIVPLFDARLDGIDLESLALKGKPDPDMFLKSAQSLAATPGRAIVFEDAVAGVEAGRRGGFGLVVGVDRGGNAAALERAGADLVVSDLGELDVDRLESAVDARKGELAWRIEQEGFDPKREREMESLFTIGNGYLGVRGSLGTPVPGSQSDLLIAGVYDLKREELPYSEMEFMAPQRGGYPYVELVALPFPFKVSLSVEGDALDFGSPYGRELRRILDMRDGVLVIEARFETSAGRRTSVRSRRIASLADPHLLLQDVEISPENHWAPVVLSASLDEPELRARHPHLERLEHTTTGDVELVRYVTRASSLEICIAARMQREAQRMRRMISIFTNRDGPDPRAAALAHLQSLQWTRFEECLALHRQAWHAFWDKTDIRIEGRRAVEQAFRFGSYHLRIASADDERVSIGARTLSGRAYEGHVFWDTEIFMLPFFLYTDAERARKLLMYRHHTLEGARRRARELGYQGACYAWESTVTGDDVTPTTILLKSTGKQIPIFTGVQQVHVTADIAFAVWRYWEATQDEDFLAAAGSEILFETARFWVSRMSPGEGGQYHIRGVVGPDEYHHSVDDNAYTNWMARFNLERAAWAAERAGINTGEAQEWRERARALYWPPARPDGVIEQFRGFFELKDYPLTADARFKAPVSRLFDWEEINRLKLVKQADVLMLPLLFPDEFSDELVAANYRYYEPITDHGSSLSPPVHAAIAARLGLIEDAERYGKHSLWLDLSNVMGNSTLGVHAATMGGTWQALVFGFMGVRFTEQGPQPDARASRLLPPAWNSVELSLAWRGKTYRLKVGHT